MELLFIETSFDIADISFDDTFKDFLEHSDVNVSYLSDKPSMLVVLL